MRANITSDLLKQQERGNLKQKFAVLFLYLLLEPKPDPSPAVNPKANVISRERKKLSRLFFH